MGFKLGAHGVFGHVPDPDNIIDCLGYWEDPDRFDKDDCYWCSNYKECLKEYEDDDGIEV